MKVLRRPLLALVVLPTTLALTGLGAVGLTTPAQAEPLPAPYTASAHADLIALGLVHKYGSDPLDPKSGPRPLFSAPGFRPAVLGRSSSSLSLVEQDVEQPPTHPPVHVERRTVDEAESRRANGPDWDRYADEYQATHGEFLGDAGFVWGPEGLRESETRVLGELAGRDVLELGSGAGQCSRYVARQGGHPVGLDLSHRQLQHSRRLDDATGVVVPSVLGTATQLPFRDESFDVVFCSFGALQFVADIGECVDEVARVLRPGGRFAFSITHPTRWMFPDDPTEEGLLASQSYWDRRPYVETDPDTGRVLYVEHHRTLGDWVALLSGCGFRLTHLVEPEWPEGHERVWGGWSGVRGRLTPGTAIFSAVLG